MRRKFVLPVLLAFALLASFATPAAAQGLVDASRTREALTRLPDSQAVLFVNLQRIFRDVVPRFVPATEIAKWQADAQKVGLNLSDLEYAIVALRLPAQETQEKPLPEFMVLLRGNFNADSFLSLARLGMDMQGIKPRQETHGSHTIDILNIKEAMKGNAPPSPYTEVGVTSLDANTLVMGIPGYLKSAIDSNGGSGGLSSEFLSMALNTPDALTSLTVAVPPSLPQMLKGANVTLPDEASRIISWLRGVNIATSMSATNYNLHANIQADTAEHAGALAGMIRIGLAALQGEADKQMARNPNSDAQMAISMLKSVTQTTQGNLISLSTSVPQAAIANLVKREMKTSPPTPATKRPTTPPRTGRRRAPRRRG